MNKENCLMGITVFDLRDKEFISKIYNSLYEDNTGGIYYLQYSYNIGNIILFNLENKERINGEDVAEWDFEDVLNNHEKYLLFNIDWADKTLEYEMENIGCDIFVNQNKMLTVVKDYAFKPITSIGNLSNFYYALKAVDVRYMVLCFEYWGAYDEYNGEYDSDCTFKGIVDMSKIEVY